MQQTNYLQQGDCVAEYTPGLNVSIMNIAEMRRFLSELLKNNVLQ